MFNPQARILVVEDHADTRELLVLVLTAGQYTVKTAGTIAEATKLAESEKFDLLLLDARLPDGNGMDLCRTVRQFDQYTPIIFCSGLAYENDKRNALAAGAQQYLVKPVDPFKLVKAVDDLIGQALTQLQAKRQSAGSDRSTPPGATPDQ